MKIWGKNSGVAQRKRLKNNSLEQADNRKESY